MRKIKLDMLLMVVDNQINTILEAFLQKSINFIKTYCLEIIFFK